MATTNIDECLLVENGRVNNFESIKYQGQQYKRLD